jgi:sec-independent protein translocase protein TatB
VLPCFPVFGFSFSELVVVAIVALVVMGPKDLPKMLRRLGQWAGKIRRTAADLRAQSGIDDALRSEGLADDIAEIRKLARGELDAVQKAARVDTGTSSSSSSTSQDHYGHGHDFWIVRDREYPRDGADAYDSLPDNAIVYAETLPRSAHARDPLYVVGDADAELPPEPEPVPDHDTTEVPGAVGPTLIGGVGLPVPYEPPGATNDAPAAAEPAEPTALPTLVGVPAGAEEATTTDDTTTSEPATTNPEARN